MRLDVAVGLGPSPWRAAEACVPLPGPAPGPPGLFLLSVLGVHVMLRPTVGMKVAGP